MMLIPKIRRERNTLSHRYVPVEGAVMATSIDFELKFADQYCSVFAEIAEHTQRGLAAVESIFDKLTSAILLCGRQPTKSRSGRDR
jgi:hypothetical protein